MIRLNLHDDLVEIVVNPNVCKAIDFTDTGPFSVMK